MRMREKSILLLLFVSLNVYAQTTREELLKDYNRLLGNYSAYDYKGKPLTPIPEGYEPFYISHYARHGSRYLTSNTVYHRLIPFMEKAESDNQLTELGKLMLKRLIKAYAFSKGKSGDLSRLGGRQHEQIAQRMYENYPEVFKTGNKIICFASTSDRARMSMEHFSKALKRLNKSLEIEENGGKEFSYIVRPNHDSIAYTKQQKAVQNLAEKMQDSLKSTINISSLLFKDPEYVTRNNKKHSSLAYEFYSVYKSMPSLPESDYGFNLFTEDQLFTYFKMGNINWMERTYLIPGEPPFYKRAYATLNNMISLADEAIEQNKGGAALRFGHDIYIMPLVYVMGIEGYTNYPANPSEWENSYNYFICSDLVPMAANVQMIFYKQKQGQDILVKFLLQEEEKKIPVKTDMWPYYHWKDVRTYFLNYMNKINPIEYVKTGKYSKTPEDETNT